MTKLLAAVLFAGMTAASSTAAAGTFKLPADMPVASITLPDAWKPEVIDRGVQAQTADDAIYLSAETTRSEKGMNEIIDETIGMLKKNKLTLKPGGRTESKTRINGLPADELIYEGKDENGPTIVSITFVTIGDTALVVTYWASFEGEKKYQKDITAIRDSIKATK